jgi:hypothetical protein
VPQLAARPLARGPRADAFEVRPRVEFDNKASNRFTVIEVAARDRPALLNRLARALFEAKLMVHSAHIATYGERAADTFYVTDLLGEKIDSPQRQKAVEKKLLEAASKWRRRDLPGALFASAKSLAWPARSPGPTTLLRYPVGGRAGGAGRPQAREARMGFPHRRQADRDSLGDARAGRTACPHQL